MNLFGVAGETTKLSPLPAPGRAEIRETADSVDESTQLAVNEAGEEGEGHEMLF